MAHPTQITLNFKKPRRVQEFCRTSRTSQRRIGSNLPATNNIVNHKLHHVSLGSLFHHRKSTAGAVRRSAAAEWSLAFVTPEPFVNHFHDPVSHGTGFFRWVDSLDGKATA